MLTLGIETSCDETACAVIENANIIRASVVSSSLTLHQPFGGVVAEIASRHALEAIDLVYGETLKKAKAKPEDVDLISVTVGPGLIGSLFVGVSFAKALSFALDIPFVGVNHIEAHLEVNFLGKRRPGKYIGVVVSGGHTSILKMSGENYHLLGETIDDAIGEAYDKVSKILGLGYPGGPLIDKLAREGNPKTFSFTKPKQEGDYNFSFSGIKTAALHLYQREKNRSHSEQYLKDFCASFQEAVVRWVVGKACLACEKEGIKTVVIGGGVSANSRLRELFTEECKKRRDQLFLPERAWTTDNAVMIALLGYRKYRKGIRSDFKTVADPSLAIAL